VRGSDRVTGAVRSCQSCQELWPHLYTYSSNFTRCVSGVSVGTVEPVETVEPVGTVGSVGSVGSVG
jgi:hypothetical protein